MQKISDDLGDYGKGVTLNVIDEESIEALIKIIEEEFCGPDILVNNAGITRDGLLMRMKKQLE